MYVFGKLCVTFIRAVTTLGAQTPFTYTSEYQVLALHIGVFNNILLSIIAFPITYRSNFSTIWYFLTLEKIASLYTSLFTDCCRHRQFLDLFMMKVYS